MKSLINLIRRPFDGLVRRPLPWKESQLISLDGLLVYTVRECEGKEREVLHRSRGWEPVSKAQFSVLSTFEDYHRHKFYTAIPYRPNTKLTTPKDVVE